MHVNEGGWCGCMLVRVVIGCVGGWCGCMLVRVVLGWMVWVHVSEGGDRVCGCMLVRVDGVGAC